MGGKAFVISKYTLPTSLPINNSTSTIFVSLFTFHVHVTVSVLLYVVV